MSNDTPEELRAQIFLSCGQSKHSDEVETAEAIKARLRELGFDTYIAVLEQTLRGVKDNIFKRLAESEYFVFVDFKREQLANSADYRGSLFSHQELAVASYLDIEVLPFQELGVKKEDGILRFIQTNPTEFPDKQVLPDLIAAEVQRRGWDPHWKNELVLERDPGEFSDEPDTHGKNRRFFHVLVRNRHRRKIATNCYVYLEKATKLDPRSEIQGGSVELKWAGYILPNAHILPGSTRPFDAFYIHHDFPRQPQFKTFSDWHKIIPRLEGEGRYEIRYLIVADNFPSVRGSFNLNLNASLNLTTLD